jgi:hypothetical protein
MQGDHRLRYQVSDCRINKCQINVNPNLAGRLKPNSRGELIRISPTYVPSHIFCRLHAPELPEPKHIRLLVTYYFQNFHPLRCFAFIHKPSYLQKLDEKIDLDLRNEALLHIICTIGAQ